MRRSTRISIRFAFICIASSGAAGAFAQDAPARADTVNLRFAWPAGTDAHIETTRFQEQVSGTADTVTGSARYRMRVHAHPAGLIISYEDFAFPAAADTTESAQLNSLAEQAAAMVPKVVVDSAGAFVGIDGVETVHTRLDSLLTQMLEPEEAATAREGLATMVTEDALAGLAAQEWNAIVGRWAGSDLVIGTDYGFEEDAALPMIPGAGVKMVSEFRVERRTSCSGVATGDDCVEIRLVSRADPDAVREILAQFTEQLLATPGVGIAFESFEMENELVLVTEPRTLRPHRVRLSKRMKGVVAAEGERGEVSQIEVRTYRYTYSR
jgi:protein required for attachment to host cells